MTLVHHYNYAQHLCFEKHMVFGQHFSVIVFLDFPFITFYVLKFGGKSSLLHWIHMRGLFIICNDASQYWTMVCRNGCFNGCSLHSAVKLHINLFNLLVNIFLVSFCIIAITICYITKFQFFLYLTTIFLCNFLPFLSASISYSNFSHFSKFIFIKRSFY